MKHALRQFCRTFFLVLAAMSLASYGSGEKSPPSHGEVRIIGSKLDGQLEIYINGTWYFICDNGWSFQTANAICRQLGYPNGAVSAYKSIVFRHNHVHNHTFVRVNCPLLNNTNVLQCHINPSSCDASMGYGSAGVRCDNGTAGASPGDIRLANSMVPWMGRVEVYSSGSWGTICGNLWTMDEATVVCKQLGFHAAQTALYRWGANINNGKGPVRRVECYGNETNLGDCRWLGTIYGPCARHAFDAGVKCQSPHNTDHPGECNFDDYTLCGYTNDVGVDFNWTLERSTASSYTGPDRDRSGNGYFAYIETSWPRIEGDVARLVSPLVPRANCVTFYYNMYGSGIGKLHVYIQYERQPRQLTWNLTGQQSSYSLWKKGSVPIKIQGSFKIIFEGIRGSSYTGDIALDDIVVLNTSCTLYPAKAKPKIVDVTNVSQSIRLRGLQASSAGRVEIFHNGRWGSVCRQGFDMKAANVVCRQLGFKGAISLLSSSLFPSGDGFVWLQDLSCQGREAALSKCPHPGWGKTSCYPGNEAGVMCKSNGTSYFAVKLSGGGGPWEGRVEVRFSGVWGTVSDTKWDIYDANVVCRQLNFSGAAAVYTRGHYGKGLGRHWLSYVRCTGKEKRLLDCNLTKSAFTDWWSTNTAGAECYKVRLTGGRDASEGRVEIFYKGYWGTVCNTDWDMRDVDVLCRQLGYYKGLSTNCNASLGDLAKEIPLLRSFNCRGDEQGIGMCDFQELLGVKHPCTHAHDAKAVCVKTAPTTVPPTTHASIHSPTKSVTSHKTPSTAPMTTVPMTTVPMTTAPMTTAAPTTKLPADVPSLLAKNVTHLNHTTKVPPSNGPNVTAASTTNVSTSGIPPSTRPTNTTKPPTCQKCPPKHCHVAPHRHLAVCICPEEKRVSYECDSTVGEITEVTLEKIKGNKTNLTSFTSELGKLLQYFCSNATRLHTCPKRWQITGHNIWILNTTQDAKNGTLTLAFIVVTWNKTENRAIVFPRSLINTVLHHHKIIAGYLVHLVSLGPSSQQQKHGNSVIREVEWIVPVVFVSLIGVAMVVLIASRFRKRRRVVTASESYRRLLANEDDEDDTLELEDDVPPLEI